MGSARCKWSKGRHTAGDHPCGLSEARPGALLFRRCTDRKLRTRNTTLSPGERENLPGALWPAGREGFCRIECHCGLLRDARLYVEYVRCRHGANAGRIQNLTKPLDDVAGSIRGLIVHVAWADKG